MIEIYFVFLQFIPINDVRYTSKTTRNIILFNVLALFKKKRVKLFLSEVPIYVMFRDKMSMT